MHRDRPPQYAYSLIPPHMLKAPHLYHLTDGTVWVPNSQGLTNPFTLPLTRHMRVTSVSAFRRVSVRGLRCVRVRGLRCESTTTTLTHIKTFAQSADDTLDSLCLVSN